MFSELIIALVVATFSFIAGIIYNEWRNRFQCDFKYIGANRSTEIKLLVDCVNKTKNLIVVEGVQMRLEHKQLGSVGFRRTPHIHLHPPTKKSKFIVIPAQDTQRISAQFRLEDIESPEINFDGSGRELFEGSESLYFKMFLNYRNRERKSVWIKAPDRFK